MEQGNAPPCFAVDFLKTTEKTDVDEAQKFFVLGSLVEAGSDTTRLTMSQIVAAALLQPDWVVRAREHLDRVCGDAGRLPTFEDKPQLPYITAAVKESLRWYPFGPIGVPHMLTTDDEYEGYKFPAGKWSRFACFLRRPKLYVAGRLNAEQKATGDKARSSHLRSEDLFLFLFLLNSFHLESTTLTPQNDAGTQFTWNMHHLSRSADEHRDPERFYPERFLDDDLNNVAKGHWAFGTGTSNPPD